MQRFYYWWSFFVHWHKEDISCTKSGESKCSTLRLNRCTTVSQPALCRVWAKLYCRTPHSPHTVIGASVSVPVKYVNFLIKIIINRWFTIVYPNRLFGTPPIFSYLIKWKPRGILKGSLSLLWCFCKYPL